MDIPEGREEVQNNNCGDHHKEHAHLFDLDSLPMGYRFCPTDVELIYYLSMKVHHQSLPHNKIFEVNLYAHHPGHLAATYKAQGEDEWIYFSSRQRKYARGKRPKRSIASGEGYWKATGAEKEIIFGDVKIGYKRTLVFYKGSHPNGEKTDWIMHEYRVVDPPLPPTTDHSGGNIYRVQFDDYVLCLVYNKSSSDRKPKRYINESKNPASTSSSICMPPAELDQCRPSSKIRKIDQHRPIEISENLTDRHVTFMNNHGNLQNQQEQQQPIVQMPETRTSYDYSDFTLNDNQVAAAPPTEGYGFGGHPAPFSGEPVYNSRCFSTVGTNPGYMDSNGRANMNMGMEGYNTSEVNMDYSTITTTAIPGGFMPLFWMPNDGDLWRNTSNANMNSTTNNVNGNAYGCWKPLNK